MSLRRAREGILDQLHHMVQRQRLPRSLFQAQPLTTPRQILILEVDLVVKEGHDQTRRRAGCATLFPLVTADGVVTVDRTAAFVVQPAENGGDVVGEETLAVENSREALCAGLDAHVLAVLVLVELDDGVEAFFEGVAVGGEADYGEDEGGGGRGADSEELGLVARVDVIATRGASVTGEDGEVAA